MIHLYTWTDELRITFPSWVISKCACNPRQEVLVFWNLLTTQSPETFLGSIELNWIVLNRIEVKNFCTLWVISTLYKNTRACLLSRAANHWEGHIPLAWNSVYIHDPAEVVILQNKSSCLMDESLFGTKTERTNKFILVACSHRVHIRRVKLEYVFDGNNS